MSRAEWARKWYFREGDGCGRGDALMGGVDGDLTKVLRQRGLFYGFRTVRKKGTCLPMMAIHDIRGEWNMDVMDTRREGSAIGGNIIKHILVCNSYLKSIRFIAVAQSSVHMKGPKLL
jgi:hypothetical protein